MLAPLASESRGDHSSLSSLSSESSAGCLTFFFLALRVTAFLALVCKMSAQRHSLACCPPPTPGTERNLTINLSLFDFPRSFRSCLGFPLTFCPALLGALILTHLGITPASTPHHRLATAALVTLRRIRLIGSHLVIVLVFSTVTLAVLSILVILVVLVIRARCTTLLAWRTGRSCRAGPLARFTRRLGCRTSLRGKCQSGSLFLCFSLPFRATQNNRLKKRRESHEMRGNRRKIKGGDRSVNSLSQAQPHSSCQSSLPIPPPIRQGRCALTLGAR